MKVHLKALGCRLNEAELEQWSRRYQQRGARVVASAAGADLTVVNTCAVTADAVRKSRQLIRRLRRENPQAKLVVSGCYASLAGRDAAGELGVDLVVANHDKDRLVDLTAAVIAPARAPAMRADPDDPAPVGISRSRSRAFVKVQDGCRYRCSYCVVTLARGDERSRPAAEIVAEVARLHDEGLQEVVLSGVHLGGYDDGSVRLTGLLQALLRHTAIPRLRLGSLEPWALDEPFFALFADPRLLPHLHLPLQSGSDRILRRMARRTRIADFRALAARAYAASPDFQLTTDIIVGYPGETDDDWQRTLEAAEEFAFARLHVFPFSARDGTKAAEQHRQQPVGRELLRRRVDDLHALDRRLRLAALTRNLNRSRPVLWERPADDGAAATGARTRRCYGYTPNFLRVATDLPVADAMATAGRIRPARLRAIDEQALLALAEINA